MGAPRVSVVQYLNTAPLVWGMLRGEQRGKFELSFTTPAHCADEVRENKVDVGIIPSIEYQRMEGAVVVPSVSIASKSEVKSVLLLCKVPLLEVTSVAVDRSSRTSVALVKILFEKFYGRLLPMTPFPPQPDEMLKHADAALIIGDPALTYQGPVSEVYDLAAEWKKFTGLPFVFALWVGRPEAELSRHRNDFESSRNYGLTHVDEIAAEYAPKLGLGVSTVKVYLTEHIDYSLDEENCKGLRLFYRLAREVGIIPAERELYFA